MCDGINIAEVHCTFSPFYLQAEIQRARAHTHTVGVISGGKSCRTGSDVDLLTACCLMYLQALSTDSIERLPVYNKTALKNYKVSQKADDWCIPSKEPLDLSNFKMAK